MNLTYRTGKGLAVNKDNVLSEKNCTVFKHRFSKSEYTFGSEDNTTFLVYVYDFQPPLWIIISFSQHPKLDLLVSGDTSTEYDLAPTLREFCGGYGLANFRWDGIMNSIMII